MPGSSTCAVLNLDTSGVDAYAKWLVESAVRLEAEVTTAYRTWAVKIHNDIVELSPQWSGNLAANWRLDVNSMSSEVEELGDHSVVFSDKSRDTIFGSDPYSRGMEPAVGIAKARAASTPVLRLSDIVYIHNPVSYADEVEQDSGQRPIRAINRIPRSLTGQIAMTFHAYTKFSNLPL